LRLLFLLALAVVAAQARPSAGEIVGRMLEAYSQLSAVHIKATRTDTLAMSETKYELAESPGKYRAYLRSGELEALAVNDGSTLWKALPRLKQWSQEPLLQKAATPDDGNIGDLHARLRGTLLSSFVFLGKSGESPELIKDKPACHVVRLRTPGARHDLCIDKQSYLVLEWTRVEAKGIAVGETAQSRTTTRITSLAVNEAVSVELFTFTPDPKWQSRPSLPMPGDEKSVMVGRAAPEFHLKSLSGDSVRSGELRGTVIFLDFWATWCPPCRDEMPVFERLQKEFEGKVRFVLPSDEDPAVVRRYIAAYPTSTLVLIDPGSAVQKRYRAYSLPTSFIVSRDGTVRQHFVGVRTESALRAAIQEALGAP
jgi:thiol-disulfide isomerase/thioredoxin